MSITHSVDATHSLVTLRYEGVPTLSDAIGAMDQVLAHPALTSRFRYLHDRRANIAAPDTSYVLGIAKYADAHATALRGARWAVVVEPEMIASFGMGRVEQILLEQVPISVAVFVSLAEALVWLDVPSSPGWDVADELLPVIH
jgi:hypothetical protein